MCDLKSKQFLKIPDILASPEYFCWLNAEQSPAKEIIITDKQCNALYKLDGDGNYTGND